MTQTTQCEQQCGDQFHRSSFRAGDLAIQLTSAKEPDHALQGRQRSQLFGKNIKIIGNETVVISGDMIEAKGGKQSKIGVGDQNSVYDKCEKVATSGAGITSSAVGEHNISGAVVKIN